MIVGRQTHWLRGLVAVAAWAVCSTGFAEAQRGTDGTAEQVLREVQAERRASGTPLLQRRAELDRIARQRAEMIAALPHKQRLALEHPIEDDLEEAGIDRYARAWSHVDLNRGYVDPGAAFLRTWRDHEAAWSAATSPRFGSMGVASAHASDGWVILVTVLIEEMPTHDDLEDLERQTVAAVNRERREHGLPELTELDRLSDVARQHSADMAERGYFKHASPEGRRAEHRVHERGIRYLRLAENLQMNRGWRDPVARAVRSWKESPRHLESMLDPRYRQTGVGVALAADGTIYFTQLFAVLREEPSTATIISPAP